MLPLLDKPAKLRNTNASEPRSFADNSGLQVLFGRIDADLERTLLRDILGGFDASTQHLPAIALCSVKSKKAILFEGSHEQHAIVEFARKQLEPPARKLLSVAGVENFVQRPYFQSIGTLPPAVAVRHFDVFCFVEEAPTYNT